MKIAFIKSLVSVGIMIMLSSAVAAQVYVTVRPMAPVIVRSAPPSARHIWIDGEWIWRGGRYQYVNGYWAAPPRLSTAWIPGHWKQTRRGWYWKPGHWRRR